MVKASKALFFVKIHHKDKIFLGETFLSGQKFPTKWSGSTSPMVFFKPKFMTKAKKEKIK